MGNNNLRDISLDLVRVTEAAALAAGRWMGLGNTTESDLDSSKAMYKVLKSLDFEGLIVIGEEKKLASQTPLDSGQTVGSGNGPKMDIVLDPIDGINLLAHSKPDAISVAAIAPRGTMWAPHPAVYMDKIVVDREVANYLVPECIDAPAAWTLALVARAKNKPVKDLVVFVLDRPRHKDLIEEIRSAGARVLLRSDGDIAGALMAASRDVRVDLMMGIGGVSEGVIAACAIKSLRGGMLGRLAPQSSAELNSIREAGLDITKILSCDELIRSNEVVFSITGITDGVLLSGVSYFGTYANTETLFLRCETGTKRTIHTEYLLE